MHFLTLPLLLVLPTVAFGQLHRLAKARGLKYFGSATDNPELTDAQYLSILSDSNEFGQITPGNAQKWSYTEPSQGSFSFTSGTWTNATLIAAMKNHIAQEVTHYKGQCYAWDVVNEAFNDDGTWRASVFYNTIGPEFVAIAFETAALYDPDVKLYYNDYNIESAGAKATSTLNLVRSLQARGVKIDGVGMQAHFIVGSTPILAAQKSNLASFGALGVEIAYTELDIRFSSLPPTAAGLAQQATDYASTVSACLATPACVGITLWDFTDKYSWIPATFAGQGQACLWNADFSKHPAYDAVVGLLDGGGAGTVSSSAASAAATTAPISTPSSTEVVIPKYQQCGGSTFTGSGTCVAGTACVHQNSYYWQCV